MNTQQQRQNHGRASDDWGVESPLISPWAVTQARAMDGAGSPPGARLQARFREMTMIVALALAFGSALGVAGCGGRQDDGSAARAEGAPVSEAVTHGDDGHPDHDHDEGVDHVHGDDIDHTHDHAGDQAHQEHDHAGDQAHQEHNHADDQAHNGDGHGHGEGLDEHGAHGSEEGWVRLTPAQRTAAGITLAAAGAQTIGLTQELPGEIAVNADRLAHIVPRFPGIAREVRKNLGDPVKAGDVLAVIEANESLALYEVKALIGGTVIEKHITLGEFVSDQEDIYVVADLSTVWVNITVYARDLEKVRPGQTAVIEAPGISEVAEGRIDYVGPLVGEATRTSIARVILRNPRGVWRPGLYVTARIQTAAVDGRVVVASRAVQTVRGQEVVFVEEGEGYKARPVETGRTDGRWMEIVSGLQEGERVVVDNAFILKSEMLKNEAGHGHAH